MANLITAELKTKISQILQDWNSSDFILAVVKKDSNGTFIEEYASFGENNYDARTTMFSLASNTKQFTALSVGLLIEDEDTQQHFPLGWKTPIKDVIPDFRLHDPIASENCTFEDALSHRSGLPRHDYAYGSFGENGLEELLQQLQYLEPSTSFRDDWQYGNIFYAIMALLPPLSKQESFSRFLKKRLLDKAGLSRTAFDMPEAQAWGLAEGHFKPTQRSDRLVASAAHVGNENPQDLKTLRGAAGLQSCAQDMVRWLKILLADGREPHTGETIFPKEMLDTLRNARVIIKSTPDWPELSVPTYGLGFISHSYKGHQMIEHGGVLRGYHSQVTHLPNDGIGLVLFSNDDSNGSEIHKVIKYAVLDSLLNLGSIDWSSRVRAEKDKKQREEAETVKEMLRKADRPTIALKSMEGAYHNSAYGTFILRDFDNDDGALDIIAAEDAMAITSWIDVTPELQRRPYGLLKTDKFWAKYMLMQHCTGDTYTVTHLLLGREKASGKPLVIRDGDQCSVTMVEDALMFVQNFWGGANGAGEGSVVFTRGSLLSRR